MQYFAEDGFDTFKSAVLPVVHTLSPSLRVPQFFFGPEDL